MPYRHYPSDFSLQMLLPIVLEGASAGVDIDLDSAYSEAVRRISMKGRVRCTAVAEGLYSWQSSRLSQCVLLLNLQLVSAGYRNRTISESCMLSSCLSCLPSLGHGMKKPAVIIAHAIIDLINSLLTGQAVCLREISGGEGGDEGEGVAVKSSGLLQMTSRTVSNRKPFSDLDLALQHNGVDFVALIEGDLKVKLLCHILGKPEDIRAALSFSDFSALIPTEDSLSLSLSLSLSPPPKNLSDWKDACIDPSVPVPSDWAMEGLKYLEGEDFEQWLTVLSKIQLQYRTKNCNSNSSSNSSSSSCCDSLRDSDRGRDRGSDEAVSLFMPSHADNIYGLLRLVFPDQTHRWRTLTPDPQSALLMSEEEDCMVVNDCTAASSAAYCSLLASISQHMAAEHYQQRTCSSTTGIEGKRDRGARRGGESTSHCERFVRLASAEVSSTNIFSTKGARPPPKGFKADEAIGTGGGGGGRPSFGLGVKAEAGVMDLCGKVIEALTSQTICAGQ
jgi:hypothetical protein